MLFILFSQSMKDWKLAVGILVMVVIDLIILIPYSVMEGLDGTVDRLENREKPYESDEVHSKKIYYDIV